VKLTETLKKPIVLAITSLVVTPLLLFWQAISFFLGAMVLTEESNPLWIKVIIWFVMVGVALVVIYLPTKVLMVITQVWLLPALIP